MAIDTALAMAEREEHTSDIYDVNPTTWCIWLVQHTIATRAGAWTAESPQQRQRLSFEGLYRWLEVPHARGEARNLYDPTLYRDGAMPDSEMTRRASAMSA